MEAPVETKSEQLPAEPGQERSPDGPPASKDSLLKRILTLPFRWARAVYDWMLRLADKSYAERALAGLSFAEASFFPIPPDPLLLAMGAGKPKRALRFAAVTVVASVLGAMLGYLIGSLLMDSLGNALLNVYDPDRHTFHQIENWYDKWGVLALLLAAITPIPFKVFTIASGAFAFPFAPFVLAALVGRSIRFFAEGALLFFFGEPIVRWIDRYFNLVATVFIVLLVGGFLLIKFVA